MSPPRRPLVILCALVALAGCGSGGKDKARTTTTTATTRRRIARSSTAAQSGAPRRRSARPLERSDRRGTLKTHQRARAGRPEGPARPVLQGRREAARTCWRRSTQFPAQARRAGARWAPQSLAAAVVADGEAWKAWADGLVDIRAAAGAASSPTSWRGRRCEAHLAAYKAARRTAPASFRAAGAQLLKPARLSAPAVSRRR